VDGARSAAKIWRRAGLAFPAGMSLMAITAGLPGWTAILLIILGVAIHTIGELWQAAGSLELRYLLVPAHAQSQYSGVSRFGKGIATVIAPSAVGFLCITWGIPGWLLLGAIFAVVAATIPPVVRWAERTYPRTLVETPMRGVSDTSPPA
jgi:hypothetical protein